MIPETTLETRRLRGDKIEVSKILNGYEMDIRKYSFSQRIINEWNKLSTDCVTASSVNMFKNKVDTSQEGGLHTDEKMLDSR